MHMHTEREVWRDNRKSDIEAVAHTQQIHNTTCVHTHYYLRSRLFHKILFSIFIWLTRTWTEMIYVCNIKKNKNKNTIHTQYNGVRHQQLWNLFLIHVHMHLAAATCTWTQTTISSHSIWIVQWDLVSPAK